MNRAVIFMKGEDSRLYYRQVSDWLARWLK